MDMAVVWLTGYMCIIYAGKSWDTRPGSTASLGVLPCASIHGGPGGWVDGWWWGYV